MGVTSNLVSKRFAFIKRAIKEARSRIRVPEGWFGDWRHVYAVNGVHVVEVHFAEQGYWRLVFDGKKVSVHDSRSFAIAKGSKLIGKIKESRRAR